MVRKRYDAPFPHRWHGQVHLRGDWQTICRHTVMKKALAELYRWQEAGYVTRLFDAKRHAAMNEVGRAA